MFAWLRRWRRRRLLRTRSLDPELWRQTRATVPALAFLCREDDQRLQDLVLLFLAEKNIEGVRGLEMTDLMRYVIAAQACLLVLNLGIEAYDGWTSIWVYPDTFVDEHPEYAGDGIWAERSHPMAGAALEGGAVALSWAAVERGGDYPSDGFNPVYHEFAHKLDMSDGAANGVPPLPSNIDPAEWKRVFTSAFAAFRERVDDGTSLLDEYAAESPAEFFAVLSEAFFETPERLEHRFPAVYELLCRYYVEGTRGQP